MAAKAMILISTALVLAQAAQVVYDPDDQLERLCQNERVNLTTRSQFATIMMKKDKPKDSSKCSETTLKALQGFNRILDPPDDNICSIEKVDQFLSFYKTFMHIFSDDIIEKTKAKEELPKSLQHFVIAYGMQVSKLCKKNMIEELDDEELMKVLDGDLAQILKMTNREFDMDKFINLTDGPVNFLTSISLSFIYEQSQILEKIQVKDDIDFYLIKALCFRRFKPVYRQVVQPMKDLSDFGFDHTDEHLDAGKVPANLLKWSKATFLCNILSVIEIDPDPIASAQKAGTMKGITETRGYTEDEKERIDAISDIVMLKYKPKFKVKLDDVVYDTMDENFSKRVTEFSTSTRRDFDAIERLSEEVLDDLTNKPLVFCSKSGEEPVQENRHDAIHSVLVDHLVKAEVKWDGNVYPNNA